ncbi:MAG: hypothetical protein KME16_15780 [Scytolyngbya sp. HA4215-MV1]|jgi:hypothetical protein|nr:hypothetical protein [Scytolyngbya sp. HA4215-MV1]
MSQVPLDPQIAQLQACLLLAQNPSTQQDARQSFTELKADLDASSNLSEMLDMLWCELLAARRSAAFWQEISDLEKQMTQQMTQNHIQLQQNYLRLMQEQ